MHADDLKIFNEKTKKTMDKLYDWTPYSQLKFHSEKCFVTRQPTISTIWMKINSKLLNLKTIFDDELTFKENTNGKVKKTNTLAGMICRSITYLDKDIFKQLFVAIVRAHLEYRAPI